MYLRDKSGLLIDEIPEARSTVRDHLAKAGLKNCDVAHNIEEVIDRLTQKQYDLVVCDHHLGRGADGQQFLELVRRKKLLPPSTVFLMITGASGYEHVSTTAEFAPDDYLLKPFTAETLRNRLLRILEKKAALRPIHEHLGVHGDRKQALVACDAKLTENNRYLLDILRIKGDLLLMLERTDEALALYENVLKQHPAPWAEVGKARALAAKGDADGATAQLQNALKAYPTYLSTYDTLAQLLESSDTEAAQQVVEQALRVAPSTQRQRHIGGLALENGDFLRAEEAFRRAVEKDRTGFFKSHEDFAGLAKSCSEQGKVQEALAALKDMGAYFEQTPELAARQAAVESQVHSKAGNTAAALAAMEKALAVAQASELDPATALEVAQACFAGGHVEDAKNIIRHVAENNHENSRIFARAQAIFASAGLGDEGAKLLDATRTHMIKLNNGAVGLAKSGELDQAIAMLREAADRLRNNAQIAINTAMALLMHLQQNGIDDERLALAKHYLLQARHADPEHLKLGEVETFYHKLAPPVAETGIRPGT